MVNLDVQFKIPFDINTSKVAVCPLGTLSETLIVNVTSSTVPLADIVPNDCVAEGIVTYSSLVDKVAVVFSDAALPVFLKLSLMLLPLPLATEVENQRR